MKKLSIVAGLFLFAFTACSESQQEKMEDSMENAETKVEETVTEVEETLTSRQKDPICDMERGSDWTDFVVKDGDTTWFCSENCKDAYVAKNPN